jgi:hypothetical protein
MFVFLLITCSVFCQVGNFARGPYGYTQNIGLKNVQGSSLTFEFPMSASNGQFPSIGSQFPVNNYGQFQANGRYQSTNNRQNNGNVQNNGNGRLIYTRGSQGFPNNQESYNCAGLAFRNFKFIGLQDTRDAVSKMRAVACDAVCNPMEYKFAFWPYDAAVIDKTTKMQMGNSHQDFHIVGGQCDSQGKGPFTVSSKNGHRPIEKSRNTLFDWYPYSGLVMENDSTPDVVPNKISRRYNVKQHCYCHGSLPK